MSSGTAAEPAGSIRQSVGEQPGLGDKGPAKQARDDKARQQGNQPSQAGLEQQRQPSQSRAHHVPAGQNSAGPTQNALHFQNRPDHMSQAAPASGKLAPADGRGGSQLAGTARSSPARQGQTTGPPVSALLPMEFHSRSPGQALQRNASTTARPTGSTYQACLVPAAPSQSSQGDSQGHIINSNNSSMQPPRSPFKGLGRQNAGSASIAAPNAWGQTKPAARQANGPFVQNDYYAAQKVALQAVQHPQPRFLGGGSQQASAPPRQALGFGVHLMAGEGNAEKQPAAAAGRQGQLGQPGVPSKPPPGSGSPHPSRSPAPSSQLPSPRLIMRSMDPEQAQALSPPARIGPDGALRKPVRHLDFGSNQFGGSMGQQLESSEQLGASPPRRFYTQPPLGPGDSPVRPVPGASPYRGPRGPPEKLQETPIKKKQCNCKNSRCLKLYCECFASGNYCVDCNCLNCCNNAENEAIRQEAVEATLERNPNAFRPKIAPSPDVKKEKEALTEVAFPTDTEATEQPILGKHHKGCHCKKSGCLKKYCECFQANVLCTEACKCNDCKNYDGSDERRLLFAGAVDTAAGGLHYGGAGGYMSPSPPPYKKARLQDRAMQSPPQAKIGQAGSGARPAQGVVHPPGRTPQKPLTKSLLSHVVKQDAVQELCKLLAIVTQEVAKNFEAQHPGLLAAQHQRQEAAFAAAASAASARSEDDGGPAGQGADPEAVEVERGGRGSPPAAAVPPEEEEQSPEALLLSCDEELPAEKEVQVALPGGLYRGQDDGGGEGAAARLYALQEQTVLEEFASCLKKIISVGQKRMRQYEESLSPPRPAYTGPPPLHYRPPPAQGGPSPQQRFPAGQAPLPARQPAGGAVRYIPQYQPQPYRPQYQQQHRQQLQPAGKQSSYRPLQQAPRGWLPPSPALGQPLPRPPYPMSAHGPIHLVQQPAPQRHPVVRPVRQHQVRPGASPPFASHTRPSGGPLHNFQPQGQRSAHFLPSQGAQHPSATRAGAPPIVIKVPAAPLPASSRGASSGGQ